MPAAMPIATVAAIMNIDGLQLAQLLQLTSPSLPVGGFSWSQGTESAIEQGWLKGEEDFAGWLQGILQHSFVFQEWPLLQRLYEAFSVADQERLQYWNALALALRETRELRQEDVQMGAALLRLCRDLNYPRALAWEQNEISYLTAFALAAVEQRIPLEAACIGLAWSWLENQIAAALKTFPLGQTAGQRVYQQRVVELPGLLERAGEVADEEVGFSLPGVVLASMQHERQYSRLFRS
ncbi:MAG: urease accessory UreF family protein [Pseudomonadota bacterium]|nr:urease accessory UreF family protein [Pseudomonadota bacterium]